MKTNAKTLIAVAVALALGTCVTETFASVSVSASVQVRTVSDFHEPLARHGAWVEVGSYGRCWRPAGVAVGWRPYAYGSWVWTDYGWYWETDEPWGWACYHYGNWAFDPVVGWIWVPGVAWSPAWVSWRTGGGYWGWAPLPPHGVIIAPRHYVFVETRHFHQRVRPNTVIVDNTLVINKTTEIKNVRREVTVKDASVAPAARIVVNEGPNRAEVEKATGNKVREMAARDIPAFRERRNASGTKSSDSPAPAKRDGTLIPERPTPPNKPTPPDKPLPPGKPTPPDRPTPPEKPTPPDKPVPPERPTPPDQPKPPEKPGPLPPAKPVPPDPPVKPTPIPAPDKPALDKPTKPVPPDQPSERREPKSKPKRSDSDKKPK